MKMLRSILGGLVAVSMLGACGVVRPMIPPKDIPAYEEKRQKQMEKYHTDGTEEPDDATGDGTAK